MASREESHLLVEGSDSSGDDSDDSPAAMKTAGAAPPRAKISRTRVVPTTNRKRNNERAAHKGISTNVKKISEFLGPRQRILGRGCGRTRRKTVLQQLQRSS